MFLLNDIFYPQFIDSSFSDDERQYINFRMKNFIVLLAFTAVLTACKKDDPKPPSTPSPKTSADLHFKISPFFGDEILEFGNQYYNVSGYRLNVGEFKLYLSYVYFLEENGDTLHLTEVAFFDVRAGVDEIVIEDVPIGEYSSIGFGIGVAPDMNSPQNPYFNIALFDNEHPLSESNGMYWSWAGGYRFVIFEGKYDTDPDSVEPMTDGYSFHTGGDATYREVVLEDINFNFTAETNVANLDFLLDRFFYSESDTIDIATQNQTHMPDQPLSIVISDHIQQAVSFR